RLSNKIDTFLHRDIDVETRVDPSSGRVHTTVTATLRNEAPASGLPLYVIGNWSGLPTGTNLHLLTLYTPHGLSRATLDGAPVGARTQDEFGVHTYGVPGELAPMSTRTLVLELEGFTQPGQPYRLDVIPQPTANPDQLTLRIGRRGAEGGGNG